MICVVSWHILCVRAFVGLLPCSRVQDFATLSACIGELVLNRVFSVSSSVAFCSPMSHNNFLGEYVCGDSLALAALVAGGVV